MIKRMAAKMGVQKALQATNQVKLPVGLLDHMTDRVLLSSDPEAFMRELEGVVSDPKGKIARRFKKLVSLLRKHGVPVTKAVGASSATFKSGDDRPDDR